MKKLFSILAIFLISTFVFAQNSTVPRFALVIGNQTYDESPLKNPVADAKLMANALKECGFDVTLATDLDNGGFNSVVAEYASKIESAGKNSISFFYYSGHGLQIDGKNYMVPTNDKKITSAAFAKSFCYKIDSIFENIPSSTQIVVLDACRNNPFSSTDSKFQKGLSRIANPKGVPNFMAFFSTSDGATADDGSGRNSLFTEKLANHIQFDFNTPISTLFNNVANDVKESTNGRQTPLVTGTGVNFELMNEDVAKARIASLKANLKAASSSSKKGASYDSDAKLAQTEIEMLEQRRKEAAADLKKKNEQRAKEEATRKKNQKEMERMQKEAAAQKKAYQAQKAKEKSSVTFISEIEDNKEALQKTRLAAADKIYAANIATKKKTDARIDEINNAPLRATEKDAKGNINSATKKKRKEAVKLCESEKTAEREKNFNTFYEKIQTEETDRLSRLEADEKTLETAVYTASSYIDEVQYIVSNYDGAKCQWIVTFNSNLFGRNDLFNTKIELTYKQLCEKVLKQKYVAPEKMVYGSEQETAYFDAIDSYDLTFHGENPPLLLEVDYKIAPSSDPSSYVITAIGCRLKFMNSDLPVLNEKKFTQNSDLVWDKKQTELKSVADIVKAYEKRDADEEKAQKKAEEKARKEAEKAAKGSSGGGLSGFMDKINSKLGL